MSVVVQQLSKKYGEQLAVNQLTFEVSSGQVVGFLGPNGAGKSTTMKMLTTYISPTSGTAVVAGFDIQKQGIEVRRRVGYLPEHNPLYLEMYVREYLHFMADLNGLGKEAGKRVKEMISLTGLGPEQHKQIAQLSKGYRQRVGLAQAMLHDPSVLILDEPTSGLDPNQVVEIRQLIREFGKDRTILLSTHIMQEVEAMCDRILIINKGNLVANDRTDIIRKKYAPANGLKFRFKEPVSDVIFKGMASVQQIKKLSDRDFELYGNDQDQLRQEVFSFAMQSGNMILEQSSIEQSLEEVFRQLTASK